MCIRDSSNCLFTITAPSHINKAVTKAFEPISLPVISLSPYFRKFPLFCPYIPSPWNPLKKVFDISCHFPKETFYINILLYYSCSLQVQTSKPAISRQFPFPINKSRKPFNDFLLGGAAGDGWYSVLKVRIRMVR